VLAKREEEGEKLRKISRILKTLKPPQQLKNPTLKMRNKNSHPKVLTQSKKIK
jgi:hypothetical protein